MKKLLIFCLLMTIGSAVLNAKPIEITLYIHSSWECFDCKCKKGSWYCWDIKYGAETTTNLIDVDYNNRKMIFTIDENQNTDYHQKFIRNGYFNFIEPTYINERIVKESCGISEGVLIQAGVYACKREGGKLIITVPF